MASGSPERVLAAAERRRAAGLLLRPVRPPDDAALAADLEELRNVSAALDEALREGEPAPDLLRRQTALEHSVRRRTLRARGGQPPAAGHARPAGATTPSSAAGLASNSRPARAAGPASAP